MLDSIEINRLYENVLDRDMQDNNISPEAVKFGIECMAHVYGETVGLNSERSQIADYTDPAHRCAYLHKYAALHTAMVRDMLGEAVSKNYNLFHRLVFNGDLFRLCCLGGGPGTDVIGVLAALHAAFGFFDCAATVLDYMAEWSNSFSSILKELGTGWYGAFGNNISHLLNWGYIGANLLKPFKPEVLETLSSASMVTMVKFTSAAACMDTRSMIRNIFTTMRPGAALLFIDNDGGGFYKLIEDAAVEFRFRPIFGPYRQENYLNNIFRKRRFGYNSCFKTTVSVQILQKPFMDPYYYPNDPAMVEYRKAFLEAKQSVLGSPPTPFLYLGENQDKNNNIIPFRSPLLQSPPSLPYSPSDSIVSLRSPLFQPPSFSPYRSPFMGPSMNLNNRLGYSSAYEVQQDNFCQDYIGNPRFVTTQVETLPCPSPYNAITPLRSPYTPYSTPHHTRRGKRARVQGCFPLRMSNFKHHLGKKLNKMKAHARAVFKPKTKKEKKHPIFKI